MSLEAKDELPAGRGTPAGNWRGRHCLALSNIRLQAFKPGVRESGVQALFGGTAATGKESLACFKVGRVSCRSFGRC